MSKLESIIDNNYKYKKATGVEIDSLINEFINSCCATDLFDSEEERIRVGVDKKVVIRIVDQVRKRKLYFYVYHDIDMINGMSELKETALYVFWLLKLQPFYWRYGDREQDYKQNFELNAKVALDFFLNGLDSYAKDKTERERETGQSTVYKTGIEESDKEILEKLYYSFRFRDWSKEALMDLAESLIICDKTIVPPKFVGYKNK